MAGVFKAGRGYYYQPQSAHDSVVIDNSINIKPAVIQSEPTEPEQPSDSAAPNTAGSDTPNRRVSDEEIERIKQFYREEGEKALETAKQRAQQILSDTEKQAEEYALQAKAQAQAIFEKSRSDGFAKGHEDGYAAGLDKCREMLAELKKVSEQINSEKQELFDSYEVEIFDTVMEIVNKITLNSLGQKDKALIKKTVKEAGKAFRNSEYVKLTLSKTDVSEEMAADADYFKKLFTNVKTVEVEVLKDAPSGTVIIDNGSEITDAGIQTQLKMIEELGRGKYRRASSRKKAQQQEEADTGAKDAESE
ncbi:MAG: hypothetical protein ACI4JI_02410 [Ruminiclostridium sp.]